MIVSIKNASEIVGVTRSTLQRQNDYNILRFTTLPDGSPGIDLSELYRVYPPVNATATSDTYVAEYPNASEVSKVKSLKRQLELQHRQLLQSEQWLLGQIDKLNEITQASEPIITEQTAVKKTRWRSLLNTIVKWIRSLLSVTLFFSYRLYFICTQHEDVRMRLFHRDTFRQIPRLIHISSL